MDLQDRLAQGDLTALLVAIHIHRPMKSPTSSPPLSCFLWPRHLTFHEEQAKGLGLRSIGAHVTAELGRNRYEGSGRQAMTKKKMRQGPLALAAALTPKQAPEEGKPVPPSSWLATLPSPAMALTQLRRKQRLFQRTVGWLPKSVT